MLSFVSPSVHVSVCLSVLVCHLTYSRDIVRRAETPTWDQLSRIKHVVQEGRGADSFTETIEEYLVLPTLPSSLLLSLSLCRALSVSFSPCYTR